MIRFILFLLGKGGFENCKSCETLKLQLEYERQNNKELLDNLLDITKPKVIEQPAREIKPVQRIGIPWNQRKKLLEEQKRAELDEMRRHPGARERVDALEKELGITHREDVKDAG